MKEWKHRCELKLLMCQPNPLRPDRVTIGYVLRDTNPEAPRVEVRFAKNLGAVRCIYPDADIEAIEGTLLEMESVLKNVTDFEQHMLHMSPEFPADFALLSGGALLTDDFEKELPLLERQFLARLKRTRIADLEYGLTESDEGVIELEDEIDENDQTIGAIENGRARPYSTSVVGRPYIRRRMQQVFHRAGVADLLTVDIPVGKYTFQGDLLKIDFGHPKANAEYRLLHATSVVVGLEHAAVLAAKWGKIKDGLEDDLGRQCELIAVIESSKFTHSEQSREVQDWLRNAGIQPRPLAEMPRLAEEVRSYLGA